MSPAIPLPRAGTPAGRVPFHGRIQAVRRQAMAWLVRRMFPSQGNLVGVGSLPRHGIQRILVCRPNHRLGNTVLMTPLMCELERHYPGAEVDVLASGHGARSVYGGFATVGELFLLHRRAVRRPVETVGVLRKLRSRRYDLVIDAASGSSSGRLAAAIARARHQLRVDDFEDGMPTHFAGRAVHALRRALGDETIAPLPRPDLRLTDAERRTGADTLRRVLHDTDDALPVLAIFPNATGAKRLDQSWWRTFLDTLLGELGPRRVVELVAADGISRLGNAWPTYFTSDPRKLAAFIEAAGTYVSADCGVMHLAAATHATTIGLFGATDPQRYAPYGGGNTGFACEDGCPIRSAKRVAAHLSNAQR